MSPRSIVHSVSKQEVRREYAEASIEPEDFRRAKWGSREGMVNRFRLVLDQVSWTQVKRWLDVGCGTGGLFAEAEARGLRFDELMGADITPEILAHARRRTLASAHRFVSADLEALPREHVGHYDLVTSLGVLQQCGVPLHRALACLISPLGPGGVLFVTTKNACWRLFEDGRFRPEPTHSWFDPDEVAAGAERAGLGSIQMAGFLPREGRVVPLAESHSFFLCGERRA